MGGECVNIRMCVIAFAKCDIPHSLPAIIRLPPPWKLVTDVSSNLSCPGLDTCSPQSGSLAPYIDGWRAV